MKRTPFHGGNRATGARARNVAQRIGLGLCALLLCSAAGLAAAGPQESAKGPPPPPRSATGYDLIEFMQPQAMLQKREDSRFSGKPGGADAKLLNSGFDGPLEVEPNPDASTATPLGGTNVQITGNIFPAADVDVYSFTAAAGDRIYAATQTLFDASASGDTVLDLLGTDGTTVLENDPNDGSFNASSSTIAGFNIPAAGTYFLRVRHNVATGTIRPYVLHFQQQSVAPIAETEPNETPATATPMPASGHVSGVITGVSPGEADFYSINLNAGDTVFLSLDMNPERDANVWNGRLGFALFGNPPANQILVANDANAGAAPADPNSEAFFFTVKDAGTYFIYVDSIVAAGLGANATYNLSVSVRPLPVLAGSCTTYTSTDVPVAIPTGPGMVASTITIPGNPRIADLDVAINLNHTFMQDLDVHLESPAGNDNGLFTDIGAATVGGPQTLMDIVLDDEAALPPAFAMSAAFRIQPEPAYRLNWFDGEDAGGVWTLRLRDDATGDGGTLNSWSLTVCEPPPPPAPVCAVGQVEETVYTTDFEADDGGFTHSGTADEWERGLPAFAPITTCASGTNCWKTDLDNTYDASSSQNLLSPNIDLTGLTAPVTVRWSQRYHVESANFDHYNVEAREVGNPSNAVRLFEWLGATMNNTVGNPAVTIAESAGWGQFEARVDSLAGLNTELQFHVDSDTTVQLTGVAIDDISVTACRDIEADLTITKDDSNAAPVPGMQTTYTIVAGNAGPDDIMGATVADTFPGTLACEWTCVAAGGASCSAGPTAGDINDVINLPVGATATYSAVCDIDPAATGLLSNTATITNPFIESDAGNNTATDDDDLVPSADVSVTKDDGALSAVPGTATVYTIVAGNTGPSDSPGVAVADTFPAACASVSWTCAPAGGATCTAGPVAGSINEAIDLPAGATATYLATCNLDAAATGVVDNTATAVPVVADPDDADQTATDSTTLAPSADLALSVIDTPDPVNAGENLSYAATLNNGGPSAAVNVEISFPLAANTTFVSASPSAGGGCVTPAIGVNGVVLCTWAGATAPGASHTLDVVAAVAASPADPLSATVTASSDTTDPDPSDDEVIVDTAVLASADLSIAVIDTPDPVVAGDNLAYAVTIGNAGPSAANDVDLSFPLDADTTFVSAAPSGAGVCVTPAVGVNGTVDCTWAGATSPGVDNTVDITVAVDAAASGSLLVTAVAGATSTDPTPANNTLDVSTAVGTAADLAITLADSPDPVTPGTNLTYLVTIANGGGSDAQDVELTTATPPDTTFVSAAASAGGVCVAPAVGGTGAVDCTWAGATAMGTDRTLTLIVLVDDAAVGPIAASAAASSTTGDPSAINNTADASTVVTLLPGEADLALTLGDAPDPVTAGEALVYTASATNNGPDDAEDVSITVNLPADTAFVSAAAPGGACVGTGPVTCTWAGTTANAAVRIATVNVNVDGGAVGPLAASASTTSTVADPTPANNTANASTTVEPATVVADLAIALDASPAEAEPGDALTLTATGSNDGPDDAQNVVITLTLGPNVLFDSVDPGAGGVCDTPAVGSPGVVTCTYAGATAPGTPRTVVVLATAGDVNGAANVSATIESDTADPTPADAEAESVIQISGGTVVTPPSLPAVIPALDRYILLLLGLLLGLGGMVLLRRQS